MCFFVFVDFRFLRSFSLSQRDFCLWPSASATTLRSMATVTAELAAMDGKLQKEGPTEAAASTDAAAPETVATESSESSAPAEKWCADGAMRKRIRRKPCLRTSSELICAGHVRHVMRSLLS